MLCPHCGKRLVPEAKPMEEADGELVEVTESMKRAIRQQRAKEEADCRTLDDFVSLGRKRGYSFPVQWANKRFGFRAHKQRA